MFFFNQHKSVFLIAKYLLIVILASFFIYQITTAQNINDQEIKKTYKGAIKECNDLGESISDICNKVVKDRLKQYKSYKKEDTNNKIRINKDIEKSKIDYKRYKDSCNAGSEDDCRNMNLTFSSYSDLRDEREYTKKIEKINRKNTISAIKNTPRDFQETSYPAGLKSYCVLRNTGSVDCADPAALLASISSADSRSLMLSFKELMTELKKENVKIDTIVNCGFGEWSGTNTKLPTARSTTNPNPTLGPITTQNVVSSCKKGSNINTTSASNPNVSHLNNGGLNTNLELTSCLAEETAGGIGATTRKDVLGDIIKETERLAKYCRPSPLSVGTDPDSEDPHFPLVALPKATADPGEKDLILLPPDYKHIDKWDRILNINYPNGDKLQKFKAPYSTANAKVTTSTAPDGTTTEEGTVNITKGPNKGWNFSYTKTTKGNNSRLFIQGNKGSNWFQQTFTNKGEGKYKDSKGNKMTTNKKGQLTKWTTKHGTVCNNADCNNQCTETQKCKKKNKKKKKKKSNCPDPEICGECEKALETAVNMNELCTKTFGMHPSCQSYVNASKCCEAATPDNDSFLIPNPSGDLICIGESKSSREKLCRKRCQRSDDEDCVQKCTSQQTLGLTTIFDEFCLYAYSDDCFGPGAKVGGIKPIPKEGTGGTGPDPSTMFMLHR